MTHRTHRLVRLVAALALAGVATAASAVTEIQWWHSMTGALNTKVDSIAAKFNATQSDYKV
ncbi:MAG: sn-glycerol-3-phosphate ABC transporter substrate-binding protein, partial [Casimicrobiaceae bacterium]